MTIRRVDGIVFFGPAHCIECTTKAFAMKIIGRLVTAQVDFVFSARTDQRATWNIYVSEKFDLDTLRRWGVSGYEVCV
jgi:hypothetical protein